MAGVGISMRQQVAAQAVIEELLRQQAGTPERTWLGRFVGSSPLGDSSVSWYRGALGEIAVGQILATLPTEWAVFHALPIGNKGADIDHLVIGPGGIFTVNTKNHSGKDVWVGGQTLMVSGQKEPHIRNADYEAKRVTKLVRARMPELPAAQPVVAILDPNRLTIKTKPEQTKVLTAEQLHRWLLKRPVVLSPAELTELAAILDDPATWPAPLLPPTENQMEKFAVLHATVRAARARRRLWSVLRWLAGAALLILFYRAIIGLA